MFLLEIDDREHDDEILKYFDNIGGKCKVEIKRCRLDCSDFAVYYGGKLLFVIERKTWNDLASSIKDGRINEQVKKMATLPSEVNKFIMVEGILRAQHQHVEAANLETKLDHLVFRKEIDQIFYTHNQVETCKRVLELIDHYPIDYSVITDNKERENTLHEMKGTSDEKMVTDMFSAIKNVSVNSARLFMDNGWSIMDFYETPSESIAGMIYPLSGKTIGPERAKIICEDMDTKHCWVGILCAVNGITKDTANIIIDAYPCVHDWTIEKLSLISKGKRSVGKKVAEKIIKLLNFKLVKS